MLDKSTVVTCSNKNVRLGDMHQTETFEVKRSKEPNRWTQSCRPSGLYIYSGQARSNGGSCPPNLFFAP